MRPVGARVPAWAPVLAIAAGVIWAVVRPLQEEHPRPYTYDEWNRVMTVTYLLFLGAAAGLWQVLAPRVRRVGRAGLVLSMVGCALLITGNVVEFWLSWMLNVPTAFDSGYSGGGWPGSYWGWGIFMLGCFVLVGAAALLAGLSARAQSYGGWRCRQCSHSCSCRLFSCFANRSFSASCGFGSAWLSLDLADRGLPVDAESRPRTIAGLGRVVGALTVAAALAMIGQAVAEADSARLVPNVSV